MIAIWSPSVISAINRHRPHCRLPCDISYLWPLLFFPPAVMADIFLTNSCQKIPDFFFPLILSASAPVMKASLWCLLLMTWPHVTSETQTQNHSPFWCVRSHFSTTVKYTVYLSQTPERIPALRLSLTSGSGSQSLEESEYFFASSSEFLIPRLNQSYFSPG